MTDPEDTDTSRSDFERTYEQGRLPAMRQLERCVLGCDYGGTSWTTRSQVDQIVESLELRPRVQLLEVGSGAGWPGLFLARITGCDVMLVDVPFIALQQASTRASEEDLGQQCAVAAASGDALPFKDGSFDALSHSDVLCCMPEKLAMLQECRRVVRFDGKMLFYVIAPAARLSESDYKEALEAGPPFVAVPGDYAQLLRDSGWRVLKRLEVTAEYLGTLRTLVDHISAHAGEFAKALGSDEFLQLKRRRQDQISAIERGLLRRETFVAEPRTN